MNLAGKTLDIYDDVDLKIAAANRSEVTGLSVLDATEVERLADKDFALVIKTANRKIRKYPIKDADSEKLSRVYFNSVKKSLHPSIAKTAEAGFERKSNEIDITKLSSHEVITHKYNEYPLHDAGHVKEAMMRFDYTSRRMSPMDKYAYAQAIVDRAADLNVIVDGSVLQYVSAKVNPVSVKLGCLMRKQSLLDKDLISDLESLEANPSPQRFEQFDKLAGLTNYVAEGKIPDGYATCFSLIKTADLKDEQIKNIPLQTIERLFDPMFAKEWQKDPVVIYKSLPMPTQAMIDKQAALNMDVEKCIPAALAMLAVASVARTKGANKVMDDQFSAKGWVPGKDCVYQKDEDKIIRKNGMYHWVDFDGKCKAKAETLPKLYSMLSGDYVTK